MLRHSAIRLEESLNILKSRDDALLARSSTARLWRIGAHAKFGKQFVVGKLIRSCIRLHLIPSQALPFPALVFCWAR